MAPSRTVDERTKALVAPVSAAVQSACADPKQDAANERSQASFNPEELAVLMQGGQSKADLKCAERRGGCIVCVVTERCLM